MFKKMKQGDPGELLREKLVSFQREIAELKRSQREQEEQFRQREQNLFKELFEVLDAFESVEKNIRHRQKPMDKTSLSLLNNMRSMQRKLLRLLSSRHIQVLEFPDCRATAEQCHVVETKRMPEKEDEEILTILKKGYIDTKEQLVLRKAEVVTVRNPK
jgi:molecular chaperone GrpE (heat shock protein)